MNRRAAACVPLRGCTTLLRIHIRCAPSISLFFLLFFANCILPLTGTTDSVQLSPGHMVDEGLRFVLGEEVRPEFFVTADTRPPLLCWSA